MTFRSRKNELAYKKLRKSRASGNQCPFCALKDGDGQVIHEYPLFFTAKNNFPYDLWEGLSVSEHIMVIPKRHIHSLHQLTPEERKAYMDIVADYDKKGYSVYTRTDSNASKSVAHLHTHLLKLGDKRATFSLHLAKPYILWHN